MSPSVHSVPPTLKRTYTQATKHLREVEPKFGPIIDRIGPCTLVPKSDLFHVLLMTVIGQLISTKAAKSILTRLETLLARQGGITPAILADCSDEELQRCGVSGPKLRTLRGLTTTILRDPARFSVLPTLDESAIEDYLRAVKGIGPWSVDMVRIFGLGRLDVLPVGDMGLRMAVRDVFGLPTLPDATALLASAAPWRPYATVATWYLWRTRGFIPQSGLE